MTDTWAVRVPAGYVVHGWTVGEGVATGAWGSVYIGRRSAGEGGPERAVALKFLTTGTSTRRVVAQVAGMVEREIRGHSRLRHEHIVRTLDAFTVDDPGRPDLDGAVVLVMELAAGSLADALARCAGHPMPGGERALLEIAEGLAYVHAAGWVHGDLKPSNVLVRDDGSHCLADLGLAAALDGTHAYLPPVASADFASPERATTVATVDGQQVRPSDDVWAFGVTASLVLGGQYPFPGETPWARSASVAEFAAGRRLPIVSPDLPATHRDLLRACLDFDPQRRPAAAEIVDRIRGWDLAVGTAGDVSSAAGHRGLLAVRPVAITGTALAVIAAWALLSGAGSSKADQEAAGPGGRTQPATSPVVAARGCVQRREPQRDPVGRRVWDDVWYCHNDVVSALVAEPGSARVVGWMETSTSWFVCYRYGSGRSSGSDVWYYTQGDRVNVGWEGRAAWGYMSAAHVASDSHPHPGIPRCDGST